MTTWIADTPRDARFRFYSRANAGEVLPDPVSPLGSTLLWAGMAPGWRQAFVEMGVADLEEFDARHPNHFGVFGGYFYLNMSWARMIGVRGPGMTPEMIDQQYYGDMPGIPPYADEARPGDESPAHTERMAAFLGSLLATEELTETLDQKRRVEQIRDGRPDLRELSAAELVARAREVNTIGPELLCRHVINSVGAGVGWSTVASVCEAVGRPELTMSVVGATGDLDSAGPAHALWDLGRMVRGSTALTEAFAAGVDGVAERLAELSGSDVEDFREAVQAFTATFGLRGPNELELSAASWDNSPRLVFAAIDRLRLSDDAQSPRTSTAAVEARAEAARAELAGLIGENAELAGTFAAGLRTAQLFDAGRERSKTTIVAMIHEMRLAFRELGRRAHAEGVLEDPDQIFMLTDAELDAFVADPTEFKGVIPERAATYRRLFDLQPPFLMVGEDTVTVESLASRARTVGAVEPGTTLQGIGGSAGQVTGPARVVTDPADPRGLEPGEILVVTVTSPAWTPLFVAAAAVVAEVGALVSHAVIVSRELGIPCVVSVDDATTKIPDGASITVDGSRGTVTVHTRGT